MVIQAQVNTYASCSKSYKVCDPKGIGYQNHYTLNHKLIFKCTSVKTY